MDKGTTAKPCFVGCKYVALEIEMDNTSNVTGTGENIRIRFKTSVPLDYPGQNEVGEKSRLVDEKLVNELIEIGYYSKSEENMDKELKDFRKNQISRLAVEGSGFDSSSTAGYIYAMFLAYLTSTDDLFDNLNGKPTHLFDLEEMKLFAHTCDLIFQGKSCDIDIRSIHWQLYRQIILLRRIVERLIDYIPGYLEKRVHGTFTEHVRTYLSSNIWWVTHHPKDDTARIQSLYYFREIRMTSDICFEFCAILHGITLEPMIKADPVYKVMRDEMRRYVTCSNDIMGFGKELANDDYDNMIYYNYKKSNQLTQVLEEGQTILMDAHDEYLKMADRLRKMYFNDKTLHQFLDMLEKIAAGLVTWQTTSKRYGISKFWMDSKLLVIE